MTIKIILLLLVEIIFLNFKLIADSIPSQYANYEVLQILKERKEKFSAYTESLDEKSGIFGSKTKRDIKNSQLILTEIIRLDNRLIGALNRSIDYKKYETVSMSYDKAESERMLDETKNNMIRNEARLNALNKQIHDLKNTNRNLYIISGFLAIVCMILFLENRKMRLAKYNSN